MKKLSYKQRRKRLALCGLLFLALVVYALFALAEKADKPTQQSYNTAGLDAVQVHTMKMPSSEWE